MRFLAAALLLAACSGGVIQRVDEPPPAPPGFGLVQIKSEPPEVDLVIDGRFMGRLTGYREGFVRLPLGVHRLTVERTGYSPAFKELTVTPEGGAVSVRLVALP